MRFFFSLFLSKQGLKCHLLGHSDEGIGCLPVDGLLDTSMGMDRGRASFCRFAAAHLLPQMFSDSHHEV